MATKKNGKNGNGFEVSIENGYLVVRLRMQKPQPSMSGKTLVVATTHGNIESSVVVGGRPVIVGVNAYVRP